MKIKFSIIGWTEVSLETVKQAVKEELGIESDDEQALFGHLAEMMNSVDNRSGTAERLNSNHIQSIKVKLLKS